MTGPATRPARLDRRRSAPRPATLRRGRRSGRRSSRSDRTGRARFLKAESLQPIGAFKIRGAYVAVASLTAPRRGAAGVITYSSGQPRPGRGPGRPPARARRRSSSCRPTPRRSSARRVEADGAEVVIVGPASEERRRGRRAARRRARPVDHPALRRRPDHRRPGDLRAGDRRGPARRRGGPRPDRRRRAGQRRRGRRPGAPAGLPGDRRRVRAGRRRPRLAGRRPASSSWPAELVGRTIADGTRTQALGRRTFAHLRALLDRVVTVAEAEIAAAVRLAAEEARLVVEPSGALPSPRCASGPREAGLDDATGPVVAVVSGGNVEPERYRAAAGGTGRLRRQPGLRRAGAHRSALARAPGRDARPAATSRSRMAARSRSSRASMARVWRSSRRIQPTTIPGSRPGRRGRRRPTSRPPAIAWSSRTLGPQSRASVA